MELKDAANIYHRICDTFVDDCFDCPFSKVNIRCNLFDTSEVDEEEIVEWERVATEWWNIINLFIPQFENLSIIL